MGKPGGDLFQLFGKRLQINADVESMAGGRTIKVVDGGKAVAELFG